MLLLKSIHHLWTLIGSIHCSEHNGDFWLVFQLLSLLVTILNNSFLPKDHPDNRAFLPFKPYLREMFLPLLSKKEPVCTKLVKTIELFTFNPFQME